MHFIVGGRILVNLARVRLPVIPLQGLRELAMHVAVSYNLR